MRPQSRTAEEKIAWIAGKQHGLITRRQLLAAGISPDGIKRRLAKGLLLAVHRGVYRVGHAAPSVEATYLAAVLACGPGSALSGRAAAHVQRLVRSAPPQAEVTSRTERRVEGILTRRCRRLDRRDVVRMSNIPMTSVPRTLVDLAAVLDAEALAIAVHQAGILYGTKPHHVEAALARKPNATGAAVLRAVLRGDVAALLSKLEAAFMELLRQERLPPARVNRRRGSYYVDCRWPERRLSVELVSYRYHGSRHAWEQDHDRRRQAHARGDAWRSYTWYDVVEHSAPTRAELRGLLG